MKENQKVNRTLLLAKYALWSHLFCIYQFYIDNIEVNVQSKSKIYRATRRTVRAFMRIKAMEKFLLCGSDFGRSVALV